MGEIENSKRLTAAYIEDLVRELEQMAFQSKMFRLRELLKLSREEARRELIVDATALAGE